ACHLYRSMEIKAKMTIEEDVLFIPDEIVLAHYAIYRMSIANLQGPDREKQAGILLGALANAYNYSHDRKITPEELWTIMEHMRSKDIIDAQRAGAVPT